MIYSFNNDNNDRQRPAGKHNPRKIIEDLWHTKRNRKGYTEALRPGTSSLSLSGAPLVSAYLWDRPVR
jgi:hypothetical protein